MRSAAGVLFAVVGCASAIAVASCGGSHGTSGGGGGASGAGTSGTGANGGDDLTAGGGWQQPPTCTGGASSGGATSTSSGGASAGGAAGAGGAGGGAGGASAANGCEGVGGGVHFAKDVGPILAACTGELCHLPPGYADLVDIPATECCDGRMLIAPFDAAHSYVLDKVKGTNLCYGARMPFDAPALADADTQAIVRWICEGAPDD